MKVRLGGLVVAMVTAGLTASIPAGHAVAEPAGSGARQVQAPVPTLDWRPCAQQPELECAVARVPLDYDEPEGATTRVSILRDPANWPGQRRGTVFVNPGGPGGSATDFASYAAQLLGTEVARRYDVVGIDPRGVSARAPMKCWTDEPAVGSAGFPINWRQTFPAWRSAQRLTKACRTNPNAIAEHMSTADTARDMDLIRQSLGEESLNYYGISYGSQLGATYASMFPERVGRFVVDGVLNPVAWSTGATDPATLPFTTRLRSARGAYESQVNALARCDTAGPRRCSFAGNAAAKWRRMVSDARDGGIKLDRYRLSYQELVGGTLGSLYDADLTFWADALQSVHQAAYAKNPVPQRKLRRVYDGLLRRSDHLDRFAYAPGIARTLPGVLPAPARPEVSARGLRLVSDPFAGVACSDTRNPTGRATWWRAAQGQDRAFRWFGYLWTWAGAPCSGWSPQAKTDAFMGPYGGQTPSQILVVGNSFDPATPVQGARAFTRKFPNSRFLLTDSWGHGALTNKCVTEIFNTYYASGATPREGTVCRSDYRPFGPRG